MIKGIFGSAETLPKGLPGHARSKKLVHLGMIQRKSYKQLRKTTMKEVNFCIEEPTRTLQHKMMMLTQVQWTRFVL
jgi:hypothetical protein